MDLRHLKTFLIFMLVFVLTAAAVSYIRINRNDKNITFEYKNRIVSFLADNHILLNRALIPEDSRSAENLYIELSDCGSEEFLNSVLGGGYSKDAENVFSKDGTKLEKRSDGAVLTISEGALAETMTNDSAESYGVSLLNSLGVDSNIYKFTNAERTDDGLYSVLFDAHFNGCEIFDSYIEIKTGAGKALVTFKNPIKICTETNSTSAVFSGASILASLPQNLNISDGTAVTVTDIRLGAEIASGGRDIRSAFSIPVWQVTTDSGCVLRYDARNGYLLEN